MSGQPDSPSRFEGGCPEFSREGLSVSGELLRPRGGAKARFFYHLGQKIAENSRFPSPPKFAASRLRRPVIDSY